MANYIISHRTQYRTRLSTTAEDPRDYSPTPIIPPGEIMHKYQGRPVIYVIVSNHYAPQVEWERLVTRFAGNYCRVEQKDETALIRALEADPNVWSYRRVG